MATWTNQTAKTYVFTTSKTVNLTGGVQMYYHEVKLNGTVVMITPVLMGGSYLFDTNNGNTPATICSQMGLTYYTYEAQNANQSITRYYWTGSSWNTRSGSYQTLLNIYVKNPSTWNSL